MSEKSWRDNVRQVVPYTAGEQPDGDNIVKLNTNENPYPPSEAVTRVIREMNTECFRLYPDMDVTPLVRALSKEYNQPEEKIFVGVGSDDVLANAFLTFFNSRLPILFPDITYSFYPVWAELYRIPYETVPVDENFVIRPKDYEKENGGVIFPNPNAPTALFTPIDQVERIVRSNKDVVVIVDEAYIDFGGTSVMELTNQYDNLLVVQTFSKSRSMAGMRIGFAVGNPQLIQAMKNVKFSTNSYTMNQTAIFTGVEAVRDRQYFEKTCEQLIQTREWAKEQFTRLGFTYPQSMANFIFVTHKEKSAKDIFTYLREQGIYVRYWDKPRINNYLRITIGTKEQMEKVFAALEQYLV